MKLLAAALALILAPAAFAVPGAKRNLGTIRPTTAANAPEARQESLGEKYALVGTISCDSCASPFQPVAVVRDLASQRLLHLRVGDELTLPSGEHALVSVIGSGAVEFKGSGRAYKLKAGGFPDESSVDDSTMIAKTPPSYMPPPPNGVRW